MATQGLAIVGQMVGSAFGGPVGGFIGATAGSYAGSYVDELLGFGPPDFHQFGPRLQEFGVSTTAEGAPMQKVFGKTKVSGHVIWMSRFTEIVTTTSSGGGGKGSPPASETKTTTYNYTCSVAYAFCEGTIVDAIRFWADGQPLDLQGVVYRVYNGAEDQTVDAKILATEGAAYTPAFKGVAYVLFEDLPLGAYGNRIPNMEAEIFAYASDEQDELEYDITAINIIPATGEHAYNPEKVITIAARIENGDAAEFSGWAIDHIDTEGYIDVDVAQIQIKRINTNTSTGESDWTVAIDQLQTQLPNISKGQLVIAWFGDDLRMGTCELHPGIEFLGATSRDPSQRWVVSGLERADPGAVIVSRDDNNNPYYGGTPSDISVYNAIRDMNDRGLEIAFYPFILMDVPPNNTLPNPYSNNASEVGQAVFPWRGRITVSPAAGYTGTVDKTATAATQVANFFGTITPGELGSWNGITIPTASTEFSFRRMVLHYAKLCAAAGGVDLFYIGTEMVQMMQARSGTSTYPAVTAMKTLAAEVSAILPSAKITYAADWSEWNGHQTSDGTNDFHHHLDPLWSDSNIDMVAIDNYMPLADWRDNPAHLDAQLYKSIYDLDYLKSQMEGGEGYEYFYASTQDRINQVRTPITDGAYSKPWIYRRKDLYNWWSRSHYNRPGGTESGSATDWIPQSKPIIFSELGCPAIDKGPNQPNVFFDPKSSESQFPYFSTGGRDDIIQRRFLEAHYEYWADPANNPMSTGYSGRMLDTSSFYIWTWDCRPFPYFPSLANVWRDGDNWRLGHWITGRAGAVELSALVARLLRNTGINFDVSDLSGLVFGYKIDRPMLVSDMLQPLMNAYFFDMYEDGDTLRFKHRGGPVTWTLTENDLIRTNREGELYSKVRREDTTLPRHVRVSYQDISTDLQISTAEAQRLVSDSRNVFDLDIPIASTQSVMKNIATIMLHELHYQRETIDIVVKPSYMGITATDVVELTLDTETEQYRVLEVTHDENITLSMVKTAKDLYTGTLASNSGVPIVTNANPMPLIMDLLDLPLLRDTDNTNFPAAPWIAAYSEPWIAAGFYRSPETSNYVFDSFVRRKSDIGNVVSAVGSGPENSWDYGSIIRVTMASNTQQLLTMSEAAVLNGANAAAIKASNGQWEIISWVTATLVDTDTWDLSQLLRGRLGTEKAMLSGINAGAEFVLLESLTKSSMPSSLRDAALNWKFGPTNRNISDPNYQTLPFTIAGYGLRPLSVVHIEAKKRISNDNIVISWTRRCRLPEAGDEWDTPLAEDREQYEIDIYNAGGTAVIRTIEVSNAQQYTYTAALQTTDFGSDVSALILEIFQISTVYDRGEGRKIIFTSLEPIV